MKSIISFQLLDNSRPLRGLRTSLVTSTIKYLFLYFLSLLLCSYSIWAEQRPLKTKDPRILEPGQASLEFGFDFLQNAKFPVSGLTGDQTSLGVMGLNFSLGKMAEAQMQWTAHNFLSVNQTSPAPVIPKLSSNGAATSDFGDLTLSTKIRVIPETDQTPSFGFFTSIQLPNASTEKGLGLNNTQYRGGILFGKHFGKFYTFGNLGLGILSNPILAGVQNDVAVYGLAGLYPLNKRINVVGEIAGQLNRRGTPPLGTESLSEFRFGLQLSAVGFRWDIGSITGLNYHAPQFGIIFGLTKEFKSFFHRK